MIHRFAWTSVLLAVILLGMAPAAQAQEDGLALSLNRASHDVAEGEVADLTFTLRNRGSEPLWVLRRETPLGGVEEDLFEVLRDGQPVAYRGPLVRWAPVKAQDFVAIHPGGSLVVQVDLESAYDFNRPGQYRVRFRGPLYAYHPSEQAKAGFEVASEPVRGRALQLEVTRPEGMTPPVRPQLLPAAGSDKSKVPFPFFCTPTQASQLNTALANGQVLAQKAFDFLATHPSLTSLYRTWFGTFAGGNWSYLLMNYGRIVNTIKNEQYWIYCNCIDNDKFAFTYKETPREIWVCPPFFGMPATGRLSKADTMVHETSHWPTLGADSEDWAGGVAACQQLAISTPWLAIDNADNYAFFSADAP